MPSKTLIGIQSGRAVGILTVCRRMRIEAVYPASSDEFLVEFV